MDTISIHAFMQRIFADCLPSEAFVMGFLFTITFIVEILCGWKIVSVVIDGICNGISWCFKKGFALVKRKFGKEK